MAGENHDKTVEFSLALTAAVAKSETTAGFEVESKLRSAKDLDITYLPSVIA